MMLTQHVTTLRLSGVAHTQRQERRASTCRARPRRALRTSAIADAQCGGAARAPAGHFKPLDRSRRVRGSAIGRTGESAQCVSDLANVAAHIWRGGARCNDAAVRLRSARRAAGRRVGEDASSLAKSECMVQIIDPVHHTRPHSPMGRDEAATHVCAPSQAEVFWRDLLNLTWPGARLVLLRPGQSLSLSLITVCQLHGTFDRVRPAAVSAVDSHVAHSHRQRNNASPRKKSGWRTH
jgi:hypothetical protein